MATLKDLKKWIERDLQRYSPIESHVEVKNEHERGIKFVIYTRTNSYAITAVEKLETPPAFGMSVKKPEGGAYSGDPEAGPGYLGCIASARTPRAGEDWTRGNDLPDGPLTEETWQQILAAIVSYELVKIHRSPKEEIGAPTDEERLHLAS